MQNRSGPENINIQRSPGSPHPSTQLEALLLFAAVAHMIIRLLDLSLPLPFSWGGGICPFYEDLVFWSLVISFSEVDTFKSQCFQKSTLSKSTLSKVNAFKSQRFLKSTLSKVNVFKSQHFQKSTLQKLMLSKLTLLRIKTFKFQ
jgi:hypothetical protein